MVLAEHPQGLACAFRGVPGATASWVRNQQPGPAMGHRAGTGVWPTSHSCGCPLSPMVAPSSSPLASEKGCPPLAVPDRSPKLGMEVATTTWLEYKSPAATLLHTQAKVPSMGGRSFASHTSPCSLARVVRVKEIVQQHHRAGKRVWIWTS